MLTDLSCYLFLPLLVLVGFIISRPPTCLELNGFVVVCMFIVILNKVSEGFISLLDFLLFYSY
jgi:hypothetical protein